LFDDESEVLTYSIVGGNTGQFNGSQHEAFRVVGNKLVVNRAELLNRDEKSQWVLDIQAFDGDKYSINTSTVTLNLEDKDPDQLIFEGSRAIKEAQHWQWGWHLIENGHPGMPLPASGYSAIIKSDVLSIYFSQATPRYDISGDIVWPQGKGWVVDGGAHVATMHMTADPVTNKYSFRFAANYYNDPSYQHEIAGANNTGYKLTENGDLYLDWDMNFYNRKW
jgi:hypothetical protein